MKDAVVNRVKALALLACAAAGSGAYGQTYDMAWSTIDGGGGLMAAGGFELSGTAGQPDAGPLAGSGFELSGGYWGLAEAPTCYANCDQSTIAPILNVADFTCFLNRFAAGDSYANCDGSTTPPILNVADFTCFLNAFAAGCP